MSDPQYIHLRNFTAYSLSEGALRVPEMVALAKKDNMPAIGVCDRNNLFGGLEVSLKTASEGIQPILGVTLHVADDLDQQKKTIGQKLRHDGEIVLFAQNEKGYQNLLKIVSLAHLEADPDVAPLFPLSKLKDYAEGLILLTAGVDGLFGQYLLKGESKRAEKLILWAKEVFEDRFYIEIARHGFPQEAETESYFVKWAIDYEIPLVATNQCYFPDQEFYEPHDAFLCISQGKVVSQDDRRRVTKHHYFKTQEEMVDLFQDLPEAILNTVQIAKRCSFLLKSIDPILPKFPTRDGRTESEELKAQAEEGLKKRLEINGIAEGFSVKDYEDRLSYELSVIEQMQFPGYFLIVADFIKWTKGQEIPVGPGRGSGAGSVVAWSLTITDLDPLQFGLLFERFLNPERVSMPDFDIDFCQERRDEVISYVQNHYGHDHVAQIITFGKLQARAVLRDVGRVLQMPYGQIDRICKLIPNNPAQPVTLAEAIDLEPQIRDEMASDETVKHLIETALPLEGLYRHASTHAAGVVIADRPLDQLVPLYRDPKSDMPVTQYNMKFVEQAGLVKFDFLGLKTLTVLKESVELLKQRDIHVDLATLPLDDENAYKLMARGYTVGVFQLESSGMRDILKKLKPTHFEEIIALVSLYRPGPMDNIPKYIAVKNKKEDPDYLHPTLEPILTETFGIMIYQEQVMQIAQVLAGYSLGGADLLRRAMGKKIKSEMDAQRKLFVEGAEKNNVNKKQAGKIFDQVAKFAGYGFNKSHAAAYALIAYQTAYMKANYPVEFMAASMTFDMGNTDKLSIFKQELQKMDVPLLLPDIQKSYPRFAVEKTEDGYAIRYALAAIKGVGEAAMTSLVKDRAENGAFKDVFDLVERFDSKVINKRQLEHLICSGAFDCFKQKRATLYHNVEKLVRLSQTASADRVSGQHALFGGDHVETPKVTLTKAENWDKLTQLKYEFSAVGFYLSSHPIENFASFLKKQKIISYAELVEKAENLGPSRYSLAGIITQKKVRTSKKGNRFAFVQLSDASAVYEVTLFSDVLASVKDLLEVGTAVVVSVDASCEEDDIRLICQNLQALDEVIEQKRKGLALRAETPEAITALSTLLSEDEKKEGKSTFLFHVEIKTGEKIEVECKTDFAVTSALKKKIGAMPALEIMEEF